MKTKFVIRYDDINNKYEVYDSVEKSGGWSLSAEFLTRQEAETYIDFITAGTERFGDEK